MKHSTDLEAVVGLLLIIAIAIVLLHGVRW
jgi:hypothetical protein